MKSVSEKSDIVEARRSLCGGILPRRKCRVVLGAVVLAVLSVAGTIEVYQLVHHSRSYARLEEDAREIADGLEHSVFYSENFGIVSALGAANRDVEDVIAGRKGKDDPELLKALGRVKSLYSASIVYVMDGSGDVVACTPYGDGETLTGKNYSFRPYFTEAMKGFGTVYPALGVTTNKRGLYYSAPVYSGVGEKMNYDVVGAIVMKVGLLQVDSYLANVESPVALISPLGIVFSSNIPDWRFKSAFGVDREKFSDLRDNKQFSALFSENPPAVLPVRLDSKSVVVGGTEYGCSTMEMSLADEFGAWRLTYLRDIRVPWYDSPGGLLCGAVTLLVYGLGTMAFLSHDKKRAAEKERREAEHVAARFGKILEESLNEIYIFDAESYRFIQVNRGARRNLGYTMEEMRELTPLGLKPEVDAEFFETLIAPLRSGERDEIQFRSTHRRKDGSIYPVEVHLQLSTVESSQVFVAMIVDITERQLGEEKLQAAKEQAEAANVAKSEFLANMSHEIRTPMNAIIGFGDLLLDEPLTDEQRKYVGMICGSGKHLLELINDILDFSKIEAGKLDICVSECSMKELIVGVESLMRPAAAEKGLEFEVLQCGSLPGTIRTDGARIRQCLINIINNAIKFTAEGHIYVNVSIEEEADGDYVVFDVEDTGIGIAPECQEVIFESFRQADGSMARKFGGTGLGLAITKQLAGLLGGGISVRSEGGKGSVFTLKIPVGATVEVERAADIYENAVEVIDDADGAGAREWSGEVLVAEDAPHNQVLMRTVLERMGMTVTTVVDGEQAVEAALSKDFDMIFMDIQMPGMNGLEATAALRRKGVRLPIVAVTANAMKGDEEECLDAGCDAYLKKPIDREELGRVIERYMSWRQHAGGVTGDRGARGVSGDSR